MEVRPFDLERGENHSHANLQRFWMIAGNKRLLLDFMVPACQHCAMGVGCLAKPVACRAKSVDGHRPVADLRRSNLITRCAT